MADWKFEFIDSTTQNSENDDKLSSVIPNTLGSGTNEKASKVPSKEKTKTFSSEFESKLEKDLMNSYVISPLNTVTGGLASPLYQSAKKIAKGATIGAIAGDLVATGVLVAIQFGLNALQNRMQEIETKVANLNNTDNALIRAGSVSKTTYYTGNIFGVRSRTDRS